MKNVKLKLLITEVKPKRRLNDVKPSEWDSVYSYNSAHKQTNKKNEIK